MVLDVGNWDESRAVNALGQSGDSSSLHYHNLVSQCISGQYFPLLFSRQAIEKETVYRIELRLQ